MPKVARKEPDVTDVIIPCRSIHVCHHFIKLTHAESDVWPQHLVSARRSTDDSAVHMRLGKWQHQRYPHSKLANNQLQLQTLHQIQ